MELTKRERIDTALRGDPVDRVPVSAWRHFIPEERTMQTLADATLRFFHEFDWDWLKVNPRSTYYAEAWGNRYDFDDYRGLSARLIDGPVSSPEQLDRIEPVSPTGGVFAEHLNLLHYIKAGIGDAHFIQTIFSPLSVLGYIVARPDDVPHEQARETRYTTVRHLIDTNPDGVHAALKAITETLAGYAAACVDAGASGMFFAIVRLAREGVLTRDEYATFGRPYDLEVLKAVQGASFNMLHLCGPHAYFDLVTDYPVHAINWATVGQGNLTLSEALNQTHLTLVGGVDEVGVLQHGQPEEVIRAAQDAIRDTRGERFLLTPGCSTALDVPAANLHALRKAVDPA